MRRELTQEFPLIGRIKGALAERTVRYFNSIDYAEREAIGVGLVKRFHKRGAELEGMPSSQSEIEFSERFVQAITTPKRPSEAPSVDRKKLLQALRLRLDPLMGSKGERFGAREWRYEVNIGPWMLATYIDVGGRYDQLTYFHRLGTLDVPDLGVLISVLSWLGISGQTSWDGITDAGITEAADALYCVCEHFLSAAPALLPKINTP